MRKNGRYSYAPYFYELSMRQQGRSVSSFLSTPVDTCAKAAVELVAETKTAQVAAKAVNVFKQAFFSVRRAVFGR